MKGMAFPGGATVTVLPPELQLGILSLLPPNDLALGGRLSCKDAAQRLSQPHHRTARLSQPLPEHVAAAAEVKTANWCVDHAQTALRELTFRRKLLLPSTAAASGCEANVEFALQLLQPHVFPELLHTDQYLTYLQRRTELQVSDVGSVAVASGLAHLLPSLAQRCPGLLDPGATLEAAARHCDLEGLQAAWGLLGQRLLSSLDRADAAGDIGQGGAVDPQQQQQQQQQQAQVMAHGVWQRILSAAAGSPGPDAEAKMEWVLDKARANSRLPLEHAQEVWGAAAASGDLERLRWLRERGFPWGGVGALVAVLRHGDLDFIVRMEREGGYLPPAGDRDWGSEAVVCAAAASARDRVPKLRWLAARGAALGWAGAVKAAAARGDLEAVQLLVGQWRDQGAGNGAGQQAGEALPPAIMLSAVDSCSIPTASWLLQQGCGMDDTFYVAAFRRGDLPMVQWLLQAGCPHGPYGIRSPVISWPANTAADVEALVAAVQLLAAEGWPLAPGSGMGPLDAAVLRHPWAVWRVLLGLSSQPAAAQFTRDLLCYASTAGCEATLPALVEMRVLVTEASAVKVEDIWCHRAIHDRDRGSLVRLRQLGLPLHVEALEVAAQCGAPLCILKWLVEQGATYGSSTIHVALGVLGEGYPAPREQERREVEAWLRGLLLLRAEQQGRGGEGGPEAVNA